MSDLSVACRNVSRETSDRLKTYLALLEKWTPRINLVAKSTVAEAWDRHFVDSAQIYDLAPEGFRAWVDMGSGGGFPGLVVAIIAAEWNPEAAITLLESDQRKATFLRTVIRETGVTARVVADRIEQADPVAADVVSARALASLDQLLGFALRHGAPGMTALFPKGQSWKDELRAAQVEWRFQHEVLPSKTNPEAVILRIEEIEHV